MVKKYDLIVIGGGSTGLVASKYANNLGARTLLVEAERIGGDCTWTGCVPSKSLLYATSLLSSVSEANELGFIRSEYNVNFDEIKKYVNDIIEEIYEEEKPEVLRQEGIDVVIGEAHFKSPKEIEVNGEIFKAKKFVIATGARSFIPFDFIEGLDKTPYFTSDNIFDIPEIPRHLIVLGAGPIGCELSQAFKRLGSEVTIIDQMERILPRDDADASKILMQKFKKVGINLVLGESVTKVNEKSSKEIEIITESGSKIEGSHLLIAVGRKAFFETLNLENARIEVENGRIKVDSKLQTSVKHIFAAGDCVSDFQFTHIAGYQGFIAVRNAILPFKNNGTPKYVPWTTFTDPEVAFVGELNSIEGILKGEFEEIVCLGKNVDRAITDSAKSGFIKVYVNKKNKVIGATIVAPRAGEMIHEWIISLHNGISLAGITGAIHVYPTYSMGNMQLTEEIINRRVFSGSLGNIIRGVSKIYRWFR